MALFVANTSTSAIQRPRHFDQDTMATPSQSFPAVRPNPSILTSIPIKTGQAGRMPPPPPWRRIGPAGLAAALAAAVTLIMVLQCDVASAFRVGGLQGSGGGSGRRLTAVAGAGEQGAVAVLRRGSGGLGRSAVGLDGNDVDQSIKAPSKRLTPPTRHHYQSPRQARAIASSSNNSGIGRGGGCHRGEGEGAPAPV